MTETLTREQIEEFKEHPNKVWMTDVKLLCTLALSALSAAKAAADAQKRIEAHGAIQRFTSYRRNLASRGTHTAAQANADDQPQYEGVIWTDGSVTLRWLTAMASTSVWKNIGEMLEIHGHPEYGTEIVWHDAKPPKEWEAMLARALNTPKEAEE